MEEPDYRNPATVRRVVNEALKTRSEMQVAILLGVGPDWWRKVRDGKVARVQPATARLVRRLDRRAGR